jgi:hypothetical protein
MRVGQEEEEAPQSHEEDFSGRLLPVPRTEPGAEFG